MSATTTEGTGLGMAPNQVSLTVAGPHIVAAGTVRTGQPGADGQSNDWWITVDLDQVLPLSPSNYAVMITQSDESGHLGGPDGQRSNNPPHIEKFVKVNGDRYNYWGIDDEFESYANWNNNGLAGFVVHCGHPDPKTIDYVVVRTGFLRTN
jgi:hypothetical protein